mgnify:CR=1 FL=1
MTVTSLSNLVLLACTAALCITVWRLRRALRHTQNEYAATRMELSRLKAYRLEVQECSPYAQAFVETHHNFLRPYFAVCRRLDNGTLDILRIPFDPDDHLDRDYRLAHAREVAAYINEKP